MPTSLVTGGAGFIGSHVIDELLAMGHRVVALDDLSGGFRDNVGPAAELVEGSILDVPLVQRLFAAQRVDYVFHLAAYAAEGLSHFIKRFNYDNNLIGSINLINAAVNAGSVRAFVFTSSIAVYGRNQLPMHEDLVPAPEDPYGIAKYAVEQELRSTEEMFGLPYIVFRPHNVYGERQNIADKYRNVVGIFINCVLQGLPLPIFGDGGQTRAFSHIDDVAPTIACSINQPEMYNQVFNIGGDRHYSVNRVAELVFSALRKNTGIDYLPERKEVKHVYSSHEKIHQLLDITAKVDLESCIDRMAQWAPQYGAGKAKQ